MKGETRKSGRRDRQPRIDRPTGRDAYARTAKAKDAIVCDACGVVYHGGRWYRGAPPLCDVSSGLCPACERIRDRAPAGTVRLHGVSGASRDEILRMIRNVETTEAEEHPLERLMDVETSEEGVTLTTTGVHLARRIAGALRRRSHGNVSIRYPDEGDAVLVDWWAQGKPER